MSWRCQCHTYKIFKVHKSLRQSSVIKYQLYQKQHKCLWNNTNKVFPIGNFTQNWNNFTQALLVVLVANIMSAQTWTSFLIFFNKMIQLSIKIEWQTLNLSMNSFNFIFCLISNEKKVVGNFQSCIHFPFLYNCFRLYFCLYFSRIGWWQIPDYRCISDLRFPFSPNFVFNVL